MLNCIPRRSLAQQVEVPSSRGTFVGQQIEDVLAFTGIPYARCRRFQLPERIESYGELSCTELGPRAPQPELRSARGVVSLLSSGKGYVASELPRDMEEDNCLTLQMYLPSSPENEKPLPVLVFVHGGLFTTGSNQDETFQGRRHGHLAATQKIAVVLVNYRLGPFGFLKTPGGEANLGVRDVLSALQWVHEEGRNFGLDVENITLGGQSSGAMLVGALLHAPSAKGLFRRVVMMSGGPQNIMSHEDAESIAEALTSTIDVWKASSSELLAAAMDMVPRFGLLPFQPCFDGHFLVEDVCVTGLDILTGVTEDEGSLFVPPWPLGAKSVGQAAEILENVLGSSQFDCRATEAELNEIVSEVQESYRVSKGRDVFRRLLSCVIFEAPFLKTARQLKASNNVYAYRNMVGAGHCGDLGFLFGSWDKDVVLRYLSGVSICNRYKALSSGRAMERLWGDTINYFVRHGKPSSEWPQYDDRNLVMALSPDGTATIPATAKAAECMSNVVKRQRRPYGLILPVPEGPISAL